MKLELKHIVPYLPYGLKVKTTNEVSKDKIHTPKFIDTELELIYLKEIPFKINQSLKECHLPYIKPILRPLSSMTKEEFAELRSKLDDGVLLKLTPNGDIYIKCNDEIYLYEVNILNDFLFSNHFDVFGLIDSGLAINRNNLK